MNLQEFIEQTLLQVAAASQNVSSEMKRKGLGEGVQDNHFIKVNFDVAVTVSQESSKDSKGGLRVLNAFMLGEEKGEALKAENVSRIRLELPIKIVGAKTQSYQMA
jgi:hypothetical protein